MTWVTGVTTSSPPYRAASRWLYSSACPAVHSFPPTFHNTWYFSGDDRRTHDGVGTIPSMASSRISSNAAAFSASAPSRSSCTRSTRPTCARVRPSDARPCSPGNGRNVFTATKTSHPRAFT